MSAIVYSSNFISFLARREVSSLVTDLSSALDLCRRVRPNPGYLSGSLSDNIYIARIIIYSVLKHPAYLEFAEDNTYRFCKVFDPILRAHHLHYERPTNHVAVYRWLVQNKTRIILTLSQIK